MILPVNTKILFKLNFCKPKNFRYRQFKDEIES